MDPNLTDQVKKRGFGGIFGRMQRGNRGAMRGDNFINIMNMDPMSIYWSCGCNLNLVVCSFFIDSLIQIGRKPIILLD